MRTMHAYIAVRDLFLYIIWLNSIFPNQCKILLFHASLNTLNKRCLQMSNMHKMSFSELEA